MTVQHSFVNNYPASREFASRRCIFDLGSSIFLEKDTSSVLIGTDKGNKRRLGPKMALYQPLHAFFFFF